MSGRMARSDPIDASGFRFAIVAARFHHEITELLVDGAVACFSKHGATEVPVHWVPGAIELPLACREIARTGRVHAAVALGCVIRGETAHFDYVAGECAAGIMRAMLETGIPIAFGVLTTETVAQAEARAGGDHGNKGWDAALSAIEMAALLAEVRG